MIYSSRTRPISRHFTSIGRLKVPVPQQPPLQVPAPGFPGYFVPATSDSSHKPTWKHFFRREGEALAEAVGALKTGLEAEWVVLEAAEWAATGWKSGR